MSAGYVILHVEVKQFLKTIFLYYYIFCIKTCIYRLKYRHGRVPKTEDLPIITEDKDLYLSYFL